MKRVGDILGVSQRLDHARGEAGRQSGAAAANTQSPIPHPPSDEPCPICKGKGFLVRDVPPGHPDFSKVVPCRCTQAWQVQKKAAALRTLSNLGPLSRMTFDSFQPNGVRLSPELRDDLYEAYERATAFAREPRGWLVLQGGYGCGKTHLAAAIANCRIALGHPALFVIVPDLLDHLRATFSPNSDTGLDERLSDIRDAPLLILDDLGAHHSTPWAQEKLFQILNHRYNQQLPTVITTNQHPDEMDPRIASRLVDVDLCQTHHILAPDYRRPDPDEPSRMTLSSLHYHREQTFDTFSLRTGDELSIEEREGLGQALREAKAFAEAPSGWLVLIGAPGCGKTHLAAAIANRQVALGRPIPIFVVVPDLLDHLRDTFSPGSSTSLDKLFEQVKSTPLLVLDDLGTESATPWAREKLFQLFNHRYVARLPTVVTSSKKLSDIEQPILSRMSDAGRCTIAAIIARSYRGSGTQRAEARKEAKGPAAKRRVG